MWLLIASVANAQPTTNMIGNELEVAARRFVTLMVEGDYETAIARFDETMTKLLPASQLEQIWPYVRLTQCRLTVTLVGVARLFLHSRGILRYVSNFV
jgi:hypothetical protein